MSSPWVLWELLELIFHHQVFQDHLQDFLKNLFDFLELHKSYLAQLDILYEHKAQNIEVPKNWEL